MESAFRTIVSALVVLATCYVLIIASWSQVLLLFLAASLGWCIYTCRGKKTAGMRARYQEDAEPPMPLAEWAPPQVEPVSEHHTPHITPERVRFPIHKLSARTLLV